MAGRQDTAQAPGLSKEWTISFFVLLAGAMLALYALTALGVLPGPVDDNESAPMTCEQLWERFGNEFVGRYDPDVNPRAERDYITACEESNREVSDAVQP